jgi:cytochrome c peroxidase
MKKPVLLGVALALAPSACVDGPEMSDTASLLRNNGFLPNGTPIKNALGSTATVSTQGSLDLGNEFFQDLGTNGRRCVSCHLPTAGWTISPAEVQKIFNETDGGAIDDGFGLGAMFRTNDGANSPEADVSTLEARRIAYSMMLTKGLIRVSMPVPANAEFELVAIDDPYGHSTPDDVSMFRRPLPSTNMKFLSAVMWDGRETFAGQTIHFDLSDQANGATVGHAQGEALSDAQRESIVAFETSLHTAATYDNSAKDLTVWKAKGGPMPLCDQDFYLGINDLLGDSKTGAAFNPVVFDLYDTWNTAPSGDARRAVARGQALFNTKKLNITDVAGINDEAAFGTPKVVAGTCTTCHDSPNAGNHSTSVPVDIGLVAEERRTSDLPLYTLRNKTTGEEKSVTDPGRAMVTGLWKDIGKFKGPILRALAARPPYFHNGAAADLDAVVEFYDERFHINLSRQEKSDLVAFLRTL